MSMCSSSPDLCHSFLLDSTLVPLKPGHLEHMQLMTHGLWGGALSAGAAGLHGLSHIAGRSPCMCRASSQSAHGGVAHGAGDGSVAYEERVNVSSL